MKYQIMFIHGGEPYNSYKDFIADLETKPIRNPYYQGLQLRWKDNLCQKFMDSTNVLYPTMPNKYSAKYSEWKIWFERYFDFITKDIILIGHSLGGLFLAKYLSENKVPFHVKMLYIISAPFWTETRANEDFHGFVLNQNNIGSLEEKTENITIIHSRDDEIVSVSHGTRYKRALKTARYIEFEDRGHFLQESFPELTKNIENLN